MAKVKRFVMLGLGSFGAALATRLAKNGCRVTGVDQSKDRVEALKNVLYEAVIGDCTDREVLHQVGIADAEAVFISLGENITLSLLAALHTKELKAQRIIVKGVTDEHGKLLKYLGVERVVFPEIEVAQELGDRMTWPNVLDFLPIDPDYSLVELAVPQSCAEQTLRETDFRRRFGVWIVGVKDVLSGKLEIFPEAEYKLTEDQLLLVVGRQEDLKRLQDLK